MNIEEGKEKGLTSGDQPGVAYYPPQPAPGTYQGAPIYPPQPATAPYQGAPNYPPQPAPGYPVSETREHDRLPCCGCGYGWFLFILGFFLGIIPWYVGVILLLCDKNKDKREKPGYIACAIMAVIGTVLVVVSVTTTRFILGFFLGIIPWYVGVILLLCDRNKDKREKPGYIACAIMAVIGTVLVVVYVTRGGRYNN